LGCTPLNAHFIKATVASFGKFEKRNDGSQKDIRQIRLDVLLNRNYANAPRTTQL